MKRAENRIPLKPLPITTKVEGEESPAKKNRKERGRGNAGRETPRCIRKKLHKLKKNVCHRGGGKNYTRGQAKGEGLSHPRRVAHFKSRPNGGKQKKSQIKRK